MNFFSLYTMFRSPQYLEKVDYERVDLDTPLQNPGDDQHQIKTGLKFFVKNRHIVYDWYNAYLRVEYKFQVLVNGANVAADTQSAPINSSFSLIKKMVVRSAGKKLYEAKDVYKVFFIKNLLEHSDDFSRTVAQDGFWYLDTDDTTVTAAAATNKGIQARGKLAQWCHSQNCHPP